MSSPANSSDRLVTIILAQLSPAERAGGVVYLAGSTIPAGTRLNFPRIMLDVPWDAALSFIDREPMANWSHSCRYLLVNLATEETRSFEAQLPPFPPPRDYHWRVIFHAPSVPDSFLKF
jgi:hypothetical protein